MSDERFIGSVVRTNGPRRFAFILRDDGKRDVFLHEADLPHGMTLRDGLRVVASLGQDRYGRSAAKRVEVIDDVVRSEPAPRGDLPVAAKGNETATG